ncbi:hypothetical protein AVEN_212663-1 [Araneus ventricosus]|uniref:Uncharacterized protein n=1 Tax=Araneus ventricosus TaxID=182803 RepID=A0A4Y2VVA1_ARAVE|nr:hypothetical protein AVEN_212663-1 [Araneus ventricosus]
MSGLYSNNLYSPQGFYNLFGEDLSLAVFHPPPRFSAIGQKDLIPVVFPSKYRNIDSALCDTSLHVWMDKKVPVNFQRKFLSETLLTGLKPPGKK